MTSKKPTIRIIGKLLFIGISLFYPMQADAETSYHSSQIDINGLTFKIDPRIELLYTAGFAAGYPLVNGLDIQYKQDIQNTFSRYQDHEVLNLWREIGPKGFVLDGPVFCVIKQMKDLNDVERSAEALSKEPEDENDYDKFVRLLTKFAIDTDYQSFFNSHQDFYRLVLENMRYNLMNFDEVRRLETYFGDRKKEYTVIISLLGSGNFGPRVQTPTGMELYCVLEPQTKCGNIPGFDNLRTLEDLVWHEFSHSFVNPLVDEYEDEINKYDHLYEPIGSSMRQQAYQDWLVTVKEHIVRAVTAEGTGRPSLDGDNRLTPAILNCRANCFASPARIATRQESAAADLTTCGFRLTPHTGGPRWEPQVGIAQKEDGYVCKVW